MENFIFCAVKVFFSASPPLHMKNKVEIRLTSVKKPRLNNSREKYILN